MIHIYIYWPAHPDVWCNEKQLQLFSHLRPSVWHQWVIDTYLQLQANETGSDCHPHQEINLHNKINNSRWDIEINKTDPDSFYWKFSVITEIILNVYKVNNLRWFKERDNLTHCDIIVHTYLLQSLAWQTLSFL